MGGEPTRVPGTSAGGGGMSAGTEFAGHRIEAEIGRGGMGVVYRARHLALDRQRALKVIAPRLSSEPRFRERFRRESRLAASIEHPNLITVHSAGEEDAQLYIAMRLVEGEDLQREVAAGGPLDPRRAARVAAQAAAALDAAHSAGLIHRDVKPANVLLGLERGSERVFLTDFGISHLAEGGETVTETGEILGSPDYVAPEQVEGGAVGAWSDIYSLGAVLYFALTGSPPFKRDSAMAKLYAHAKAHRPRPSALAPWLPAEIDAVIARAMAIDPGDRYGSASDLAVAATEALAGAGSPPAHTDAYVAPASPHGHAETPATRTVARRRLRMGALVAVPACLAVIAALLVATGPDDGDGGSTPAGEPEVAATVPVGGRPAALTVGELHVWVASQATDSLYRIDPATDDAEEAPVNLGGTPRSVRVGFGSVWVALGDTSEVLRLDPDDGKVVSIPVAERPSDVALNDRFVWVANEGADRVSRIDPQTNEVTGTVPVGDAPRAIAAGADVVWVANINDGTVTKIDSAEAKTVGQPIEAGQRPSDLAVSEGVVWAMDNYSGQVIPIDGATLKPGDPIDVGSKPRGIKVGYGYAWVALGGEDEVVRIDLETRELAGDSTPTGAEPADLALGAGSVWTSDISGATVTRITPR